MARPRSEDKRYSILSAAIETLAELGERVSISKIAKVSCVGGGRFFTYFCNIE
ncbi:TetR/AcrR family transcriptional regulator, partial [Acinetobacter baumannii]